MSHDHSEESIEALRTGVSSGAPRPSTSNSPGPIDMILMMGVTGSGKSTFINNLVRNDEKKAKVGHTLEAETKTCKIFAAQIGATTVLIVDTPGFNDPKLSDSAILSQLAQILSLQHQFTDYKINLKGIVYLHRITDNRYDAAAERTFDIMQKICGQRALKNVALVTTMWDTGVSKEVARSRERELHTLRWSAILDAGASMYTFKGKKDLAGPRAIVSQLVGGEPVVLELQEELQRNSSLLQTTAGAYARETLENLRQQSTADPQQDHIDAERVKEEFEAGMSTLERRIGSETQETIEEAKKKDRGNLLITFLHVLQSIAQYGNLVMNILELQGIL